MDTNNMMPFAFMEGESPKDKSQNIIKVIGVGGGGSNAVKNMYKQGVHNVQFAICNTDSQALARADIPVKIQLGKAGLGVGGKPEKGREAAEYSIDAIRTLFEDDTQMVFITCGMGGGTGTGAGPVIANVAKEKGILTVGVVTIPFVFEGRVRIGKALLGVEEMRKNVDALLVINNQRLCEIYADGITKAEEAFAKADEIVTVAAKSISEIITMEGIVSRDFCDVQSVMENGGDAIMSVGMAKGENRIEKAFVEALKSPLLNNVEIEKARRLLYVIYSSDEHQVTISELSDINLFMEDMAIDVEVLWGLYRDNSLGEEVKVVLIATDFVSDENSKLKSDHTNYDEKQKRDLLIQAYYGDLNKKAQKKDTEQTEVTVAEPQVTTSVDERQECIQVAEEGNNEEKNVDTKETFLNRFIRRLGDIMDSVE